MSIEGAHIEIDEELFTIDSENSFTQIPNGNWLSQKILMIGCGALAREMVFLQKCSPWAKIDITCIPATLHNQPQLIAAAVEDKILRHKAEYDRIYCAYADCGTAGALDTVLARHGVPRLPGAHCYAFFSGLEQFDAMAEEEIGTFYLTDFLARHFETLVFKGLGLDRNPELIDTIFAHYKKLVYLSQCEDPVAKSKAEAAAAKLGLEFEHKITGYGMLADFFNSAARDGQDEAAVFLPPMPIPPVEPLRLPKNVHSKHSRRSRSRRRSLSPS